MNQNLRMQNACIATTSYLTCYQNTYLINTLWETCYQIFTFVNTLVDTCARNSSFNDMTCAEGKQHA